MYLRQPRYKILSNEVDALRFIEHNKDKVLILESYPYMFGSCDELNRPYTVTRYKVSYVDKESGDEVG